MLDIAIIDGLVVDGTGSPPFPGDLGIQGDRIAQLLRRDEGRRKAEPAGGDADVSPDLRKALRIIDAAGHVVAPGFIDMHSHADFTLLHCPEASSLVRQGITTVVTGQCGLTPAPLLPESRRQVTEYLGSSMAELPWDRWSSFADYLGFLIDQGIAINIAPLVGHGTLRMGIVGFDSRKPEPAELNRMQELVSQAMSAGAVGVSSGLIYPPGSYAATEELIAVSRPAAAAGGIYFSHIRGEGESLLDAIAEAIAVGRHAEISVQISHLKAAGRANWGKVDDMLGLIDGALGEGVDVGADMYPYLAGSTFLHAMLPEWAQEGGKEAILRRLKEPSQRDKMTTSMKTEGFFQFAEWDKVLIGSSPANPACSGRYVADLAAESAKDPFTWVFDALLETELQMHMIIFIVSEDNVRTQLKHPAVMIGTDGSGLTAERDTGGEFPHPRSFGTCPRVLARYVREEKLLSMEEAVHKMSGQAAERLHLGDRGVLKSGFKADVVVFHPEEILDKATYENPFQYPAGIPCVLVNGELVVDGGSQTDSRPGCVVTH